jgi:hypothetical protein
MHRGIDPSPHSGSMDIWSFQRPPTNRHPRFATSNPPQQVTERRVVQLSPQESGSLGSDPSTHVLSRSVSYSRGATFLATKAIANLRHRPFKEQKRALKDWNKGSSIFLLSIQGREVESVPKASLSSYFSDGDGLSSTKVMFLIRIDSRVSTVPWTLVSNSWFLLLSTTSWAGTVAKTLRFCINVT